jgi:hypothetical protein
MPRALALGRGLSGLPTAGSALFALPTLTMVTTEVASRRGSPRGSARVGEEGRQCRHQRIRCTSGSQLGGNHVVYVDLLQQKKSSAIFEGGEGLSHLEVGHHRPELAVKPTEEGEDEGQIPNRITVVIEGGGHHLEFAVEVGDRGGSLLRRAELGREEEGAGLPLTEKLILEVQPRMLSLRVIVDCWRSAWMVQ